MNPLIWKAMVYALTSECANGRPLIESPTALSRSGPCPHCRHRIDPSEFAFWDDEGAEGKKTEHLGIVVCAGCLEAVICKEPGKFEPMPRAIKRKLSKVTRRFIEKNQELIRIMRRGIN
jgi:hypothetical protein